MHYPWGGAEGVKVGCDIIEDEPYLERGCSAVGSMSCSHALNCAVQIFHNFTVKLPFNAGNAAVRYGLVRNSDDET